MDNVVQHAIWMREKFRTTCGTDIILFPRVHSLQALEASKWYLETVRRLLRDFEYKCEDGCHKQHNNRSVCFKIHSSREI